MLVDFGRLLDCKSFQQEDAARALGVHQGQISKILRGHFVRSSGLPQRLFAYANEVLAHDSSVHQDSLRDEHRELERELTLCLMNAWDRTSDGAKALISILDGLAKLRKRR